MQFNGLFTDDFNRVMYRLTGIDTFLTAADCFYVQMNQITSLWIRTSVSKPATEPHWTPLALDAEGFSSFVLRRRSALRFGGHEGNSWRRSDGFLGSLPVLGLKQGSGSFHCHPAQADCFLLTRNERGISRLLYGSLSRESIWERMISISLERGGHTCALTAAPLVCMPGRENLVSSFNWTCHANGPPAARGWRAQQAQPHC